MLPLPAAAASALKRLELPWLEHEYSLYHYYTIQAANARLRDFSRIRELEEKLAEAHQVLEVVQKELKTLRPLRRKRGGAEGARDTGVQTTTAALTEGATQTDNKRPSIRNANTQTDVVEAPPPPPPEAEAPAAAPAAEEMPGALSERLRTAQETLASLASTLSEGEIEAWLEQMVSTRGTLMDDAVAGDKIEKCVRPNLDDLVPVVKREEITSIAQLLRRHFEELKLIYRYYCTHRVVDASLAFALSEVQWLALCDDCELTHLGGDEINTRLIFQRAHTARTAVEQNTVARSVSQATAGRPRKQPVLNMREFLGALVRVALEASRGAGALSGATAKLAALARPAAVEKLLSERVLPRAKKDRSDELRLQMAKDGVGDVAVRHAGALQRVYRYYSQMDSSDAEVVDDHDKTLNCYEWMELLQECGLFERQRQRGGRRSSIMGSETGFGRPAAVAIFVQANAEEWNEHLHSSEQLTGESVQMTYTEFVEALVRVADLKVEEQGTLAAKLDAFLQNTFLPAVPQQALDGGTLALADAIGVD